MDVKTSANPLKLDFGKLLKFCSKNCADRTIKYLFQAVKYKTVPIQQGMVPATNNFIGR